MRSVRAVWTLLFATLAVAGALAPPLVATEGRAGFDHAAVALVVATYATVGAVVVLARPGHAVGLLMLAGAAAWGLGEALLAWAVHGIAQAPGDAAYALAGVVGSAARGLGWLLLVVGLPLLFPDGRPDRRAARLATACVALFAIGTLVAPEPLEERLAEVDNPIGLPESWRAAADLLAIGALALAFVCLGLAVARLVRRWRAGDAWVRQQVLVFAVAFALPLLLLPLVATPWSEPWMFALVTLPVPVAVAVALFQRRLYDVQLVANRTATYVALSVVLAAIYALVVGGVGAMFADRGTPWLPWAAAGVVAVAFAPVRDSLQRAANRLTYGRWSAPAELLAQTGRRLSDAADGPALLRSLTDELVHGLGLEYAEITDRAGHSLARTRRTAAGDAHRERTERLALTAYGDEVGTLHWSGRLLREDDRRLLADLARQMGGVVHTAGLVEELREAQERLVAAREQERRRIRRDLHDGLGPALAGLGYQVDAIANLLEDGRPLDDRLDRLQAGLRGTVTEVRRIVEGLRPPALDDLGLFGAVAELGHELAEGSGLALTLDLPATRPVLPAAVEVVAYRVAQEALTNLVRHAHATSCHLAATLSPDALVLEVSDDGHGGATPSNGVGPGMGLGPGVGLGSMRERAGEIGGCVEVRDLARGTAVTLRLPLRERTAP